MEELREYGGIDRFRLVAAFLIVAIHTWPLASVNLELDFLAVHVFARIAVPFFLMSTGFFVLAPYLRQGEEGGGSLVRPGKLAGSIRKTGLLYAAATLIYLPVCIYAGFYSEGNAVFLIFKNLIFDGTFYHLWYLPASIIGLLLLYTLGLRFSLRQLVAISLVLYFIGLFGDSYYGFAQSVSFLNAFYDAGFQVFSYTRNGLFYAPIFLAMGAMAAKPGRCMGAKPEPRMDAKASLIGFAVSMALMLAEGAMLHRFGMQRHDSMYIMLVPCMFFLFRFLLTRGGKTSPFLRGASMWVYILHPLFIIVVRGVAKATGMTDLLMGNSIIRYSVVCLLSFIFAAIITGVWLTLRKRKAGRPAGGFAGVTKEGLPR